jgi:hypothetical protein
MSNAQDSVDSVKDKATEAVRSARDGVGVAKDSTWHALTSSAAMLAKAVSAATVLVATVRKLKRDDGLAWFGLARRRSPFVTVAIFGAGTAVGAGAALLFAPMSGRDLRHKLLERVTKARQSSSTEAEEHEADGASRDATPSATGSQATSPRTAAASAEPNGESAAKTHVVGGAP